jgi:hypothetical protein
MNWPTESILQATTPIRSKYLCTGARFAASIIIKIRSESTSIIRKFTPKHGSWLNMAEIEIAILERNALSRRLDDEVALRRQVLAVETERNQQQRGICLPVHFT